MKVSFVIPIWNNFHLINQLMVDIKDNCTPDEIIVVDDCSTDKATLDGIMWWAENYNVKVLRPIENLGFLKASNYGIKKATGDIICLISSDVRVYKDLAKIAKGMAQIPEKILLGGKVYNDTTGWNQFGDRIFPYVEGWLLIAKKEHWEELGYFDERFAPFDFEDVQLSTVAISKGFRLAQITPDAGTVVEHIGAQTIKYGEARQKVTEEHRKIFESIWITQQVRSQA